MVNEVLLDGAARALGTRSYSDTVNRSLQEAISLARARGVLDFIGRDVWHGDLATMRGDRPKRRRRA
jgi:hypothetical protein